MLAERGMIVVAERGEVVRGLDIESYFVPRELAVWGTAVYVHSTYLLKIGLECVFECCLLFLRGSIACLIVALDC